MEIPAGPATAGPTIGSGITTGTPIPATSLQGLPRELLRPQVIEAVVMRSSPLLLGSTGTTSGTSTLPLSPAATPAAPAPPVATGTARPAAPAVVIPATLLTLTTAPTATQTNPPATAPPLTAAAPPARSDVAPPNLPLLQIAQAQTSTALFRVALQWQGKTFDVMSPLPLPAAATVKIQVSGRNELILRSALATTTNTPSASAGGITSTAGGAVGAAANAAASAAVTRAQTTSLSSPAPPQLNLRQQALREIPALVRENLPRQQPLTALLPVLRALIAPQQQSQMPPALARTILNLWQSLPTPKQLQQPEALKRAMRDSGSFFEANTATARAAGLENPRALPRVLGTDIKAQITLLLTLLKSRASTSATNAAPASHGIDLAADVDMVYQKPLSRTDNTPPSANVADNSAEVLLQQLGKMLEAGLSRIHLHQLDAVASRHTGADAAPTVPTWVMELPVRTQHGYDRIQVRIEEHAPKVEDKRKKQWLVQLGFDLHELGKLSATLSVIEHSVAATLWAEQEETHRTVQRELTTLREGLEAVGVNVTDMQCRHGIAPERSGLIMQRLVDTHS
ncbi:MAG: flagellar hook-length control protein FliK [Spongiibacteraceae bacterium]